MQCGLGRDTRPCAIRPARGGYLRTQHSVSVGGLARHYTTAPLPMLLQIAVQCAAHSASGFTCIEMAAPPHLSAAVAEAICAGSCGCVARPSSSCEPASLCAVPLPASFSQHSSPALWASHNRRSVSTNQLSGTIPSTMGQLTKLTLLCVPIRILRFLSPRPLPCRLSFQCLSISDPPNQPLQRSGL